MKPFKGINHGTAQINLMHLGKAVQMLPIEIHLKEDGDLEGNPSFAIVSKYPEAVIPAVVSQISLKMLNEGLNDIGYEIKKITNN